MTSAKSALNLLSSSFHIITVVQRDVHSNQTVIAHSGADGSMSVPAPQISGFPGKYLVVAFMQEELGSASYRVGV